MTSKPLAIAARNASVRDASKPGREMSFAISSASSSHARGTRIATWTESLGGRGIDMDYGSFVDQSYLTHRGAKEGTRTPTRVTPLEPEGTASSGNLATIRDVSAVLWVHMRPQNAAELRGTGWNSGSVIRNPPAPRQTLYWPVLA